MNPLLRLLSGAKKYRGRLALALVAMAAYGAAQAFLGYQIMPIFDDVLAHQRQVGFTVTAVIVGYFVKGLGAFVSSYLMTDVGQRVVEDLRNRMFRHTLGQSAAFF